MLTYVSLEHIKWKIKELASKIDAPAQLLPAYGHAIDHDGFIILLGPSGQLHYVSIERGKEFSRKTTNDQDTLLYWVFDDITFAMACDYELKHRVIDQDPRRVQFTKKENLLALISSTWRLKAMEKHRSLLKEYPFDDLAQLRINYLCELVEQGYPRLDAKKLAYEQYPVK